MKPEYLKLGGLVAASAIAGAALAILVHIGTFDLLDVGLIVIFALGGAAYFLRKGDHLQRVAAKSIITTVGILLVLACVVLLTLR